MKQKKTNSNKVKSRKLKYKRVIDSDFVTELILIILIVFLAYFIYNHFSVMYDRFQFLNLTLVNSSNISNNSVVYYNDIYSPIKAKQYGFFPSKLKEIKDMIRNLEHTFEIKGSVDNYKTLFSDYDLKFLILPHAGYRFSLKTMLYGIDLLKSYLDYINKNEKKIKRIIIFFPPHYAYINDMCVVKASKKQYYDFDWNFDDYAIKDILTFLPPCPNVENYDHAFEVYGPLFKVKNITLPVVAIGINNDYENFKKVIQSFWNDSIFIISSDMTHYGKNYGFLPFYSNDLNELKEKFDEREMKIFNAIETLNSSEFEDIAKSVCGRNIIKMLIMYLNEFQKRNISGVVKFLNYSSSYDVIKDYNIVGYASFAFFVGRNAFNRTTQLVNSKRGDIMKNDLNLTKSEMRTLLKLARKSIEYYFQHHQKMPSDLKSITKILPELNDEDLIEKIKQKRGVFVTLTEHGMLRGCIGYIMPIEPIYKAIVENAWNAAFNDPRFEPLKENELEFINIEISILTEPKPLEYKDADDLINKLNRDMGVVLQYNGFQATFLPQVWEQLPNPEEFLMHLSLKAGLDPYIWKKRHVDIFIYYDFHFDENELGLK